MFHKHAFRVNLSFSKNGWFKGTLSGLECIGKYIENAVFLHGFEFYFNVNCEISFMTTSVQSLHIAIIDVKQ